MSASQAPSPSVIARAEAIRTAMKEVRQLHAKRQIRDALAMRNGPSTTETLELPLQSDVRVWREKDGWNGPYKLIAIDGETCTIQMIYGPTNFRSTVVKPFYTEEASKETSEVCTTPDIPEDRMTPDSSPLRRTRPMVIIPHRTV